MHQLFSEIPQTQQCIPYDYFKTTHYIFPALILRFGQLLNCWTVGISGVVGVFFIYLTTTVVPRSSDKWLRHDSQKALWKKNKQKNKQQRASTTAF